MICFIFFPHIEKYEYIVLVTYFCLLLELFFESPYTVGVIKWNFIWADKLYAL